MTDQEINLAVAHKLGYADVVKRHPDHIPNYCHSIEAAWEIVERLDQEWCFSLNWHLSDGKYHAEFYNKGKMRNAQADTAPMAIALAFLKLP